MRMMKNNKELKKVQNSIREADDRCTDLYIELLETRLRLVQLQVVEARLENSREESK